ncbi:MAG: hypothetical protein U9P80_01065 [Thermodesulfobacteriota bacterium]|nr:hypothetical protein [Thermodesulfobacteriota bacterium]
MDMQGMKGNSKIYIIGIAIVLGIIFVLQNFEQTSFQFLVWTILTGPKWIIITITFILGMAFGYLLARKKQG